MTQPDIRGDRVVFAWEGDLYTTSVEGGTAIRLTSHPAGELAPKLSPDGKWIAYSTFNNNVLDVWVMPSEGGAPTRLTWAPLGGQVVAWTPDSRHVVFRSRWGVPPAARDQKLYQVGPRRLDARAAPARPGPGLQLLPGRLEDALRPQGQRGLLLEALQGRAVPGHLDGRLHRQELQGGDRLRGPQRLPDVGRRHDVLQLGSLGRRHHQPLGAGPEDGRRPPGHDVHRLRRDVALDRREAHRLRPERLPVRAGRRGRRPAQGPGAHPVRRLAPAGPLDQPLGVHPVRGRGRRREGRGPRRPRRRLPPRARGQGDAAPQPDPDAGRPRGHPAPLAGRQEGRVLLGRDRRVPALRPRRGHRRDDAADDRPRPQGLPPALVARREEDPVRRQGLLALRGGPRHEEADEDRRVALPRQRRVHLGGERLRLVAGQPLGRVLAPPREPQQRDRPLRHGGGPEGPAHRRLLREPEPALRRGRRLSLLPLLPELPDRDGPLRGQPHRGQPGPGDGRAAAQGREAALRQAPGDGARGEEGRRPGPLPRGRRGARVPRLRAARGSRERLPPPRRQGLRRLVLGARSSPRPSTRRSTGPGATPSGRSTSSR